MSEPARWSVRIAIVAALARWHRRCRLPARSLIISPRESTVIAGDGSVRSVQSAHLALATTDLDRLWKRANLENLAKTYWRFLTRATLGFVRVVYGPGERRVVLLVRPLTLLRFSLPEYELAADHGKVTWRILDGLLVARAGRGCGFLSLSVQRHRADPQDSPTSSLHIQVEVSNFYPSIAANLSTPFYEATQSVVHVLVTHAFLRSLATLELAESQVGVLADS